jgi:type VI secretion system secreted protein Hcp
MALNAYIAVLKSNGTDILGSVTQRGRENWIMVIGCSHEVSAPRDAASGVPTGKRQHKPLVIVKELDRSTPLLMHALTNNENIEDMELRFFQPSPTGQEQHFFTIKLKNANISNIRFEMLNNRYPESMSHREREYVSFCYQCITWVWEPDGIEADDDWESPLA